MINSIEAAHQDLLAHPIYKKLNTLDNIRCFMKYHVFAVWDFMSLLKSLQKNITCVEVPWNNSKYDPELVRLINEIVLAEESDIDQLGNAISHFNLYLNAMREVGADTTLIESFLGDMDFKNLPPQLQLVLSYHLNLALNGKTHQVASSFFYGREKMLPEVFTLILETIRQNNIECPSLIYYLERHIELDGEEHGPKALKCLNKLINSDLEAEETITEALNSLEKRKKLWDFILEQIKMIESNNDLSFQS